MSAACLAIVEAALLDGHSRASSATRYGVGRMSVNRHAANGMAPPEVTAKLNRSIAKERKRAAAGARDCARGDRALAGDAVLSAAKRDSIYPRSPGSSVSERSLGRL
jgi:hypothetical protein